MPCLLMTELDERAAYELGLAHDHMTPLGRRIVEEEVAGFPLGLHGRYARTGRASVTLSLPMGRQDIADHPGLTIETVSRLLTQLDHKRSMLIVPGHVRLLDFDRLEDPAAQGELAGFPSQGPRRHA
ncbi:helix-turn-helix domain-containing protein [Methylobacterium sp. WL122]|nr:helix-turn-helix domain-containing protein [Methylobacterium sp. WL122]